MIPGMGLLRVASRLIRLDTVLYYRFAGRATNDIGQDVTEYDAPREIRASVQAVDTKVYQELGLDFQKNYVMIYTETNAIDVSRDSSGDQIEWNGKRYQLLSNNSWHRQDGWVGVMCIEVAHA